MQAVNMGLGARGVAVPQYRIALREVGTATYAAAIIDAVEVAADVFHELTHDADREHVMALYLSALNAPIGCEIIAIGGRSSASFTPAEVFKGALLANASTLVIGHNHTSGNVRPSNADVEFTRHVRAAGEVLGIPLLDHVIVAPSGEYHSMREHGGMFDGGQSG